MALLHCVSQVRLLLLERNRPCHGAARRSEEALRTAVTNCRRRRSASAGGQTRVRRQHWQVASHHARALQLLRTGRHRADSSSSEVAGVNSRHRIPDTSVAEVRHVGITHSVMQRSDAAVVVDVDVGDIHHAKTPAVSTPPRMEPVTGSEREPAEAAPSAEADAKTKAAAPAPERYI